MEQTLLTKHQQEKRLDFCFSIEKTNPCVSEFGLSCQLEPEEGASHATNPCVEIRNTTFTWANV